jgi:1,2-phenylacetyl-CoA epoxidase PaaB subunit
MDVWDVFGKRNAGDEWSLVGGLKAPDDPHMALLLARESFFRHKEGVAFAVRKRGAVSQDLIVDPEPAEMIGGLTDRSYRRQEAYAGVGARLRRVSEQLADRGVSIDRPRPPDQRIRGDHGDHEG